MLNRSINQSIESAAQVFH